MWSMPAEKTWQVLEAAVHEINNHNASGLSFEELYRWTSLSAIKWKHCLSAVSQERHSARLNWCPSQAAYESKDQACVWYISLSEPTAIWHVSLAYLQKTLLQQTENWSSLQECLQHGHQQIWRLPLWRPCKDPQKASRGCSRENCVSTGRALSERAEAQMGPPQQVHADDPRHPDGMP